MGELLLKDIKEEFFMLDADVNSLKMQETEHGWGEGEESILDM